MSMTSVNGYSRRMDKLEEAHGNATHIIWRDNMNNLDEDVLIAAYCGTHPQAHPLDTFLIVQWISTPDQDKAPLH